MGQRLALTITSHGQIMANAYYHWSGYTGSSAEMTNDVIKYLNEADKSWPDKEKAIYALYRTGARFGPEEIAFMEEENIDTSSFEYVFDDKIVDRNSGLLCVSDKGAERNIDAGEVYVYISINTGDIEFLALDAQSPEQYREEPWEQVPVEILPTLNMCEQLNMYNTSWTQFYQNVIALVSTGQYTAISKDGKIVFSFIE